MKKHITILSGFDLRQPGNGVSITTKLDWAGVKRSLDIEQYETFKLIFHDDAVNHMIIFKYLNKDGESREVIAPFPHALELEEIKFYSNKIMENEGFIVKRSLDLIECN